MDQPICPACKAENDEEAVYCDQCGQPFAAPAGAEEVEGGCPACGGVVQSRGEGKGVCASCGLELFEAAGEAPSKADAGMAERMTAEILKKTSSGAPLEQAVAEACREAFAAPAAAPEASAAGSHPCPLCGIECSEKAPRCVGCGIWFHSLRTPQPCPRCERTTSEDKCACGAILTLPQLLEYIEPSVRFVCTGCKAPYAVFQAKCPDCGGGLLSADRIKAFAAGEAGEQPRR
jgi:predicted amidophosphoribosyltransferase